MYRAYIIDRQYKIVWQSKFYKTVQQALIALRREDRSGDVFGSGVEDHNGFEVTDLEPLPLENPFR